MADLTNLQGDPTLDAVDAALEAAQDRTARPYLGMSAVGGECARALYYTLRFCTPSDFKAKTIKLFEDGHRGEDIQAARLRMVPGIELYTADPATGKQFGQKDLGGHFRGHLDGAIHGLVQAPKTWHVWEHKQVSEDGYAKLTKLKEKHDEKDCFALWNPTYYAQATLYMHYTGMKRHYLTVSSPGGRKTQSLRTEYDPVHAAKLIAKADKIIFGAEPPPKLSEDPTWFGCKPYGELCRHHAVCHQSKVPPISCRTCCYATPEREGDGVWSCNNKMVGTPNLSIETQRKGCGEHLPLPFLVTFAETVDAGADWILFRRKDNGKHFVVCGATAMPPCGLVEKYDHPSLYHSTELSAGNNTAICHPETDKIRETFGGRISG